MEVTLDMCHATLNWQSVVSESVTGAKCDLGLEQGSSWRSHCACVTLCGAPLAIYGNKKSAAQWSIGRKGLR